MKRYAVMPLALLAIMLTGAERPAPSTAGGAASRGIAMGVNLLRWDQGAADGGWTRWSPRPDLAPGLAVDRTQGARGVPALRLTGGGRRFTFGGWRYTVSGIQEAKAYRFSAAADVKGVPSIRRNVLCRITWTGDDLGSEITPVYVTEFKKGQGYSVTFDQTFIAPPRVTGAVVDLFVQWAPMADVVFKSFAFETAAPAAARIVKVATVYWRPQEATTPAENVDAFIALVDKAAAKGADVVLLPEAITSIGAGLSVPQAAQPMPGEAFFALSAKAREHKCYIIYGAYEKEGGVCYNSAFIIARDGTLAGTYRKVQLPDNEIDSGLSPGEYFMTFELDFGKVGLLICHDTAFSEPSRVEMLDGAEMIFVPIWGGDVTQLKARAIDNGIWVVTSGYDVPSMIIDPTGQVAAMTWQEIGDGVAFNMINLSQTFRRPWIGDWHNQVIKQRRTDAYIKIIEE